MYTKKSILRLAVCLAFVMTLLVSMAAPSLATYGPPNNALVGTEQNPVNAAITKCLQVGQETTVPNITFTFIIQKISINDATDAATLASMPTIGTPVFTPTNAGSLTVSFTSGDVYNAGNNMTKRDNQVDSFFRESTSLFPATTAWTRSGIYVYRVTEQQSVNITPNPNTETLTLSKAQYDLHVYVVERTAPATGYYVWAIGAYRMLNDEGTSTGGGTGNKVNPQPGGPGGGGSLTPYSQMIFNNKYLRHGSDLPPVNPNTDVKLKISKNVTGMVYDSTLYFTFNVLVNKPAISTKTTYKVYIYEGASMTPLNATQLQANVNTPGLVNSAGYITCTIGQSLQVKLKHNQYMAFTDIDAGATYAVTEQGTQLYSPSYVLTKSGSPAGTSNAASGATLSTPTVTVTISPTNAFIDTAAFTNLRDTVTPTGITVNDMPYYALIVVGVAALCGYLFFRIKVRKDDETAVEVS